MRTKKAKLGHLLEEAELYVEMMEAEESDEAEGELENAIVRATRTLVELETNYMLGWRYLSYEMLEEKLEALLTNIYGS